MNQVEPKPETIPQLLHNRDYLLLLTAQAISSFGDAMTNLALIALVNQLTGSTTAIATLTILIAVPTITVGLTAGSLVDRLNRKTTMIVSDALRAVLVVGLVLVTNSDGLWWLYMLGFLQACVGTFFNPARGALVGKIVPQAQLLQAGSLGQTVMVMAGLLGTGLSGLLIGTAGHVGTGAYWLIFIVDALTFALSALFVAFVRTSGKVEVDGNPTNPRAVLRGVAEGVGTIARTPTLLAIMVAAMIAMFGFGAMNVLMVPFLTGELKVPLSWFGSIELASVIGMILGGGLTALLASKLQFNWLIGGGLLLMALMTLPMSIAGNIWHVVAMNFALTLLSTPVNASVGAFMQGTVPNQILGRVSASLNVMIQSASLLSMALSGVLAGLIGVRGVFVVTAGLCALAGIYSLAAFRKQPTDTPKTA